MNTVELLEKTLAYIEQPGRWNQGDYWTDEEGVSVTRAAQVRQCCLIGAIALCTGIEEYDPDKLITDQLGTENPALDIIDTAIEQRCEEYGEIFYTDIVEFNDSPWTRFDHIKDVLERAIKLAKEQP